MRRLIAAALATLAAPAAWAQTDVAADASSLIAAEGLQGAEATLAVLPAPSPSDRFALGGVRFLRGIERALQLRYRLGQSADPMDPLGMLPVLRLPIADNPAPEPFAPAMVADLFAGVEADMAGAIATLGTIGDEDDVGVAIDLADLWFDVDADGARAPGEGLLEITGAVLGGGFGEPLPPVTIRFDTADAAWLSAYAHLLSGVSELVLAVRPTEAVARVTEAADAMAALGGPRVDPYGMDAQFGAVVDGVAMILMSLEGTPDPARTQAARAHLLAVVADNRTFWDRVAREADNEAEWIPNKRQVSATGLPFPPETGPMWLAVLADAEAVLTGERLIPFWRLGPGAGIDLRALMEDPPPLGLAGLVQGAALVPYMREGPLADGQNLQLFSALVRGDGALYAVVLN